MTRAYGGLQVQPALHLVVGRLGDQEGRPAGRRRRPTSSARSLATVAPGVVEIDDYRA